MLEDDDFTDEQREQILPRMPDEALADLREQWAKKRAESMDMEYVYEIPTAIPEGRVLVHNMVQPQPMFGMNGFRYWLTDPNDRLVVCDCDWAPELGEHYRLQGPADLTQEQVDRQNERDGTDLSLLEAQIVLGIKQGWGYADAQQIGEELNVPPEAVVQATASLIGKGLLRATAA